MLYQWSATIKGYTNLNIQIKANGYNSTLIESLIVKSKDNYSLKIVKNINTALKKI